MIKSMTGYGKSNITINLREYQVEIKSINHRYLDISVKMPRTISYLEGDVKKEIQHHQYRDRTAKGEKYLRPPLNPGNLTNNHPRQRRAQQSGKE